MRTLRGNWPVRAGTTAALAVLAAACPLSRLAAEDADASAQAQREFRQALQYFKAEDREKREKAFAAIGDLTKEAADALTGPIEQRRKVFEGKLLGYAKKERMAAVALVLKPDLDALRKDAVSTINDKNIYPDANHGAAGQPTVDAKVAAVIAWWNDPLRGWAEKDPGFRETIEGLREMDGYCRKLSLTPKAGFLDEKALAKDLTPAVREALCVQGCTEILVYNESVKDLVDPEEFANVMTVNEYRMMLGLAPLELDLRLTIAARLHSEEMRDKNYFSHDSPTPELRDFASRCRRQGFAKPTGENIATGPKTGRDAFNGWYHSSGHHRNMIGGHNQMGCGRGKRGGPVAVPGRPNVQMMPGDLWTQDFGKEPPVRNPSSRPKPLAYMEQALRLKPDDAKGRLALAQWCAQNGLDAQKVAEAERVVAMEPENAAARWLLGYVKRGGEWVKVEIPGDKKKK